LIFFAGGAAVGGEMDAIATANSSDPTVGPVAVADPVVVADLAADLEVRGFDWVEL